MSAVPDEQRPHDVLGALPRTRPHRRSEKRKPQGASSAKPTPAKPARAAKGTAVPKPPKAKAKTTAARKAAPLRDASAKPKPKPQRQRLRQPAQPAGTPARGPASARPPAREVAPARRSGPPSGGEIVSTAVQAAAELAEIGLTAGARALRNALSRLPRP
jgi:hypothetical protein